MESLNRNDSKKNTAPVAADASAHQQDNEETEFENPNVDPGFESSTEEESNEQEQDEAKPEQENDALNYKNDREHGAYNPKNI